MQKQFPKQQQKKESLPVKLNQVSFRPSVSFISGWLFFAAAASSSADKGGYLLWHISILPKSKNSEPIQ